MDCENLCNEDKDKEKYGDDDIGTKKMKTKKMKTIMMMTMTANGMKKMINL